MRAAAVPRGADESDIGVYGRLLEWGAWSKDRRAIFERRDEVAGDFRLTDRIRDRILKSARSHFPPAVQAIDRTVASLKFEHDLLMLEYLLRQYFLDWKRVEEIASEQDLSEYDVAQQLQRAMREVGHRLPRFEEAR